ncbi:beta-L-arabinofuranosidase domain-containing protein [Candidatus Omnitrophota bacterium]
MIHYKTFPVCEKIPGLSADFRGHLSDRLKAITDMWLIPAPVANPAMIGMFRTRDRERDPVKLPWTGTVSGDVLPWSGEFVGKHLLSSQLVFRMTGNPELKVSIEQLVRELISTQGEDGYLGPFSRERRLTGSLVWDVWGHYHIIQALLVYHEDTHDKSALNAACKAADLICDTYLLSENPMTNDDSNGEMNYALIHAMVNLHRRTGNKRYLDMAEWIVKMWEKPGGPEYMKYALEGRPTVEMPAHRWESAHDWQGMIEMYFITGEERFRTAFNHIWQDTLQGDRHNTGGWTSGEGIQNNPYHQGAIETCCTVAWIALSIDMLRLTGNSLIADELELSTWNGNMGGMHPSGRWWTYNTPMDGAKRASTHDITFQARAGSPELNCCSVNAPRGLGMIQDWALMKTADGFALNWYGPCTLKVPLDTEGMLEIDQSTTYPSDGKIRITISLNEPLKTSLKLRIPSWSEKTAVKLNGETVSDVIPGTYLEMDRSWLNGDEIEMSLDMSTHFWVGERECDGKVSLYRGPILLAWDQRFNGGRINEVPGLDVGSLESVPKEVTDYPQPIVMCRAKTMHGNEVILCDFATAGMTGTLYRSWLPVQGIEALKNKSIPVWAAR